MNNCHLPSMAVFMEKFLMLRNETFVASFKATKPFELSMCCLNENKFQKFMNHEPLINLILEMKYNKTFQQGLSWVRS